jgi:UDPglucose--hexose-1-phosphate uridylyltransferase
MTELRRDPVSGSWTVSGYAAAKGDFVGECPFCPGHESMTPETISQVTDKDGAWLIRCFLAGNPPFVLDADESKSAEGLYDKMGNLGAHEIIVESNIHAKTFGSFTEAEFLLIADFYMERIRELKKDKRIKYIQIFRNHGELAGSYIFHPHSHVLATPILPRRIEMELYNARRHYLKKERCLFCDIAAQEVRQNKRVVSINTNFVALCPFASRFPYEMWVLPRFHDESFEHSMNEAAKRDLATLMLDVVKRLEKVANAYTVVLHTSPNFNRTGSDDDDVPVSDYFHWHMEILPRDLRTSRYKREDQFYVVSVTPEEAAVTLKTQSI